eukprot:COSAG06_NODE_362_length_16812_cov_106.557710_16_plen_89_part_00
MIVWFAMFRICVSYQYPRYRLGTSGRKLAGAHWPLRSTLRNCLPPAFGRLRVRIPAPFPSGLLYIWLTHARIIALTHYATGCSSFALS